jgi:hypothetical protein
LLRARTKFSLASKVVSRMSSESAPRTMQIFIASFYCATSLDFSAGFKYLRAS